jgi:hypothetical protein
LYCQFGMNGAKYFWVIKLQLLFASENIGLDFPFRNSFCISTLAADGYCQTPNLTQVKRQPYKRKGSYREI